MCCGTRTKADCTTKLAGDENLPGYKIDGCPNGKTDPPDCATGPFTEPSDTPYGKKGSFISRV